MDRMMSEASGWAVRKKDSVQQEHEETVDPEHGQSGLGGQGLGYGHFRAGSKSQGHGRERAELQKIPATDAAAAQNVNSGFKM